MARDIQRCVVCGAGRCTKMNTHYDSWGERISLCDDHRRYFGPIQYYRPPL